MFNQNGVYYDEQHTISFGSVSNGSWSNSYNTWTSWHLIPTSRPYVAQPAFTPKFVEVPGMNGQLDLTNYLTGGPTYGMRTGSFSFYMINHDGTLDPENLRYQIVNALHGKTWKMKLQDDPNYYYEGRFTVGNVEPGQQVSTITISYTLNPYRVKISDSSDKRL